MPDPVGEITSLSYRPTGIQVGQMRVPPGVIGIIYESRPNVTVDAAALCLKSGNACILRGGSEAIYSNQAIAACGAKGLGQAENLSGTRAKEVFVDLGYRGVDVPHVTICKARQKRGVNTRRLKRCNAVEPVLAT